VHGFMKPAEVEAAPAPSLRSKLTGFVRRNKWFMIVVVAPTLLVAGYLYAFAADQYESEAHYLVRGAGSGSAGPSGGLGQLLGMSAAGGGAGEAMSISDYLTSHDVVTTLKRNLGLVEKFRRPEADYFSKLPDQDPTPENLLRYYKKQVDIHYDTETSITTLKVRAFRPGDAYDIAKALLRLGEQRINTMNARSYSDAVALSRKQRDETERALRDLQVRMTNFRQTERDVNPAGSAEAQIGLVSKLQGDLSAAKSQLATTTQLIGSRNPQVDALRQQVRSLEGQVAAQSSRLTGGANTIAVGLGGYEALSMQQQFLAKRYDAVSSAYEAARQQAVRQQLYVVRVVDANLPVRSIYPKRGIAVLTLLAALLLVYGIGWLIAAGVREHAV